MEQANHSQEQNSQRHSLDNRSEAHFREASEQLALAKTLISETWEKRVRRQVKAAEGQTSLAIVNTLSIFLDELAKLVGQADQSGVHISPERGMSRIHGEERAKLAGYFLPQLLKEFSILREVIIEVLLDRNVLTHQVRSLIDQAIDSVISIAATEFIRVQHGYTEDALKRAEMSNRDLEHFAAVAAHDLKSPLASMKGYLNLISEESPNMNEEARQYLEAAQKSAERMLRLIDRLLDYAKLTKVNGSFQIVDINSVIQTARENLSESIERTQAQVATIGTLPKVLGDSVLLTQLFQNLIANSIKFHSKSRPEIEIRAEEKGGVWRFSLKDNGIGFESKDQEDIFTMFKKLSDESQGAGIGLATCRRVVELHGGTIWADSVPGDGSIFYFTLPQLIQKKTHH